ncbi:hypothetical protein COB21_01355 [Candidatus Aerophobetes bacterium]|uniref:Pseudouridine synthase RsuA/RluA-like domain-containing protein n=1 Tax=Aerophobetes bacterium TaxID=2030807 RepID=A0A2A4X652_UNCAE|nr:MAG: hypothetical protein COB21_01355 [Candidatus Aerophobetes bacterium]
MGEKIKSSQRIQAFSIRSCSVGTTLLDYLKSLDTEKSSTQIKSALDLGACRINGSIERFGKRVLVLGDRVKVDIDFAHRIKQNTPKKELKILYEDESVLILNKPVGLVVDKQSIQAFLSKNLFLVHRLDKATSGALCLAKTSIAQKAMETLFKKRQINKAYLAVVCGNLTQKEGVRKTFLAPLQTFDGQTLYGSKKGREVNAITRFHKVSSSSNKKFSTLWCQIETGKTHQIRVHLKEIGHPIVGDLLYGREADYPLEVDQMLLHSYKVAFENPISKKKIEVTAPMRKAFKAFL